MARTEISTLNIIIYFFGWNCVAKVQAAIIMHFKMPLLKGRSHKFLLQDFFMNHFRPSP
jgi:hypothetical protein